MTGVPTITSIQSAISRALNHEMPSDWGAFRCTDRDGLEYVEVIREDRKHSRFMITITEVDE